MVDNEARDVAYRMRPDTGPVTGRKEQRDVASPCLRERVSGMASHQGAQAWLDPRFAHQLRAAFEDLLRLLPVDVFGMVMRRSAKVTFAKVSELARSDCPIGTPELDRFKERYPRDRCGDQLLVLHAVQT
jgi:hypothetical protein